MAALTTITSAIVRTALGAVTNKWSLLIKHVNINKWARMKPVRGNYPAGTTGKYGLQLSDWSYLKPRGGGTNSEPLRAGDFRGYEHDKDLAGPVIYCLSGEKNIAANYTPAVNSTKSGSCRFRMNTSHENVRLIPSDLGINNYYWGIKVGSYYKTLGSVLQNEANISFSIILDLTNPASPSFTDLPYMSPGAISWELFISSASAVAWTLTQPAGYIKLPGNTGETWGSKTIVSSGTFTLNNWIGASVVNMLFESYEPAYIASKIVCTLGTWHIDTIPLGFTIKDALGNTLAVNSAGSSGDEIRISSDQEGVSGEFIFHDSSNNPASITVESAAALMVTCIVELGETFTITDNGGSIARGSDSLSFGFTDIDGFVDPEAADQEMFIEIYDAENIPVWTGSVYTRDGQTVSEQVTISRDAVSEDVFTVMLLGN